MDQTQTWRDLIDAAAHAAQHMPLEEINLKGRHQRDTEAYKISMSEESKNVVTYMLKNKMSKINAAARERGILLQKPKGPSLVAIGKGYLTTSPQELCLSIPLTQGAKVITEAGAHIPVEDISIVLPRSDFGVDPLGSLMLIFLFETCDAEGKSSDLES